MWGAAHLALLLRLALTVCHLLCPLLTCSWERVWTPSGWRSTRRAPAAAAAVT